jgi:hypothetical protein
MEHFLVNVGEFVHGQLEAVLGIVGLDYVQMFGKGGSAFTVFAGVSVRLAVFRLKWK